MKIPLILSLSFTVVCAALPASRARADDLRVRPGSIQDNRSSTGGGTLRMELRLLGDAAHQARGVRILDLVAHDDTGAELEPMEGQQSYSFTPFESIGGPFVDRRSLWISLESPLRAAKSLQSLEGKIEVFIPENDPESVITVPDPFSRVGTPVDAPVLTQAGAQVMVVDQNAFQKAKADEEFGPVQNSLFYAFKPGDLGLFVADPHHRVILVEFQTRGGEPLQMTRRSSFSGRSGMWWVYSLQRTTPADLQVAIFVMTQKSIVSLPLKLVNIPLP